jgi:pimeloyl-ACP methyl ester carboxylesterase
MTVRTMDTMGDDGSPGGDRRDEAATASTILGRLQAAKGDETVRRMVLVILAGLLLVGGGTAAASWITTDGGDVTVSETTVETESNLELDATVYEPDDATAETPRPAVLLIHGLGAERRTMSSLAIEFADRGYVAVTLDQPGHGTSDPPAFADDWGGPAALSHVRSMETVDGDRVALVGHSMGGFASLAAAKAHPDGYRSIVLLGSTYGFSGAPDANTTVPRNTAVVFGTYDEFAPLMYNVTVPGDVDRSEKLAAMFGTEPPVEHGRTYGSIENGTARQFTAPGTIHGAMFYSPATIADTIEWVERTTGNPAATDAADDDTSPHAQRWHWATLAQAAAFLGMLLLAVATTAVAWRLLETVSTDRGPADDSGTRPSDERSDPLSWPTMAVVTSLIAGSFLPAVVVGSFLVPSTAVTTQSSTTGFVLWGIGSLLLVVGVLHWRREPNQFATIRSGIPDRDSLGRAVVAGVAGTTIAYLCALLVGRIPGGALTAWVATVQPLTPVRWVAFLVYLVPLGGSIVAVSVGLSWLPLGSGSLVSSLGRGLALTCSGLLVLLALQYIPLFAGFGMPIPTLGALAIPMLRATTLLACLTVILLVTTRVTDSPWPGGVLAGLLVTWWIVATSTVEVAL